MQYVNSLNAELICQRATIIVSIVTPTSQIIVRLWYDFGRRSVLILATKHTTTLFWDSLISCYPTGIYRLIATIWGDKSTRLNLPTYFFLLVCPPTFMCFHSDERV